MSDLLRAAKSFPAFMAAVHAGGVHMVEVSPALRQIQRKRLGCAGNLEKPTTSTEGSARWIIPGAEGSCNLGVQWHDGLEEVPDDMPLLMVGQEILDAFPIHQFEYVAAQADGSSGSGSGVGGGSTGGGGWRERMVDLNTALPADLLSVGAHGTGTEKSSPAPAAPPAAATVASDAKDSDTDDQEHWLRFVLSQVNKTKPKRIAHPEYN
jgi:hypothetical protein